MSKFLFGATMALSLIAVSAPALAADKKICLSTRDMRSSTPKDDGTAITFKMNDGSVWRNDLKGRCPDLKFNGFAWTIRNPGGTVCDNEEIIKVLQSGQICALGKFTQVSPARGKTM
ncbi:MAG: hypothetical protein J0I19_00335 [Alphaproteobacteria bacterium]|nr:hypothetical protein [Alphaproteobacteria bacterium]